MQDGIDELSTENWPSWRWAIWRAAHEFTTNPPISTPAERRAQAVKSLQSMGTQIEPKISELLPLLIQENTSGSAAAVLRKLKMPPEALPLILEGCTENSPIVRMNSSSLLAEFYDTDPRVKAVLVQLLQDPIPSVQISAVRTLRNIQGDPTDAALALVQCLQDPNQSVRTESIVTLSTYGVRGSNAIVAVTEVLPSLDRNTRPMVEHMVLNAFLGKTSPTEIRPQVDPVEYE